MSGASFGCLMSSYPGFGLQQRGPKSRWNSSLDVSANTNITYIRSVLINYQVAIFRHRNTQADYSQVNSSEKKTQKAYRCDPPYITNYISRFKPTPFNISNVVYVLQRLDMKYCDFTKYKLIVASVHFKYYFICSLLQ